MTQTSRQANCCGFRSWLGLSVGTLLLGMFAGSTGGQIVDKDPQSEAGIDALLGQLTLEEKVSLLSGATSFTTASVSRLGIRGMRFTDGPYGVRSNDNDPATVFPVSLALAATWNPELLGQVGAALGEEARALGNQVLLGPNLNLVRSPLSGRNFETYGEDPVLTARLGTSFVRGVQSTGVAATPKHYVGNEQETERSRSSSNIDTRTLQEIYLAPFAAVVRDAQPWAVMTAYNRVNGIYMSEHAPLVRDVLKQQWAFDGVAMSDWGGTHSLNAVAAGLDLEMPGPARYFGTHLVEAVQNRQVPVAVVDDAARRMLRLSMRTGVLEGAVSSVAHVASTAAHRTLARTAAAEAITLLKNSGDLLPLDSAKIRSIAVIGPNADTAIIQGGGSAEVTPSDYVTPLGAIQTLVGGVRVTHVPGVDNERYAPAIDPRNLSPTRARTQRGLNAHYYPNDNFSGKPVQARVEERIGSLIFGTQVAEQGKNNLSARWSGYFWPPTTGSYRFSTEHIVKSPDSTIVAPDGRVEVRVRLGGKTLIDPQAPAGPPSGASFFPTEVRQASVDLVAGKPYPIEVEYASHGLRINMLGLGLRLPASSIEQAVQAARNAEVALVFVGSSTTSESEGRDRDTLRLFGEQDALVEAVVAANPRTVVVLNTGAPVEMPWVEQVPAIVEAWLPGQEGPRAVADMLFGRINPSGKLPVTFPKRVQDNPSYLYYPGKLEASYGEGLFIGYRYYDKKAVEPLFAFGHGLSYTRFEYSNLRVPTAVRPGERFAVSVDIENVGVRAGVELAQLYLADLHCSEVCALRELQGFGRVQLQPGESQTVTFHVEPGALAHYDTQRAGWHAEPGQFEIAVGASSRDLRQRAQFVLESP